MYDKSEWVDMNRKIKWGNDTYDYYKSSDGKYDILHIKGEGKELNRTVLFPIEMENPPTHDDLVKIVADTLIRLNI